MCADLNDTVSNAFSPLSLRWCAEPSLCVRVGCQELATEGKLDNAEWSKVYQNQYASSWWYHLKLCFMKKLTLLLRDVPYVRSQIGSSVLMGEQSLTGEA